MHDLYKKVYLIYNYVKVTYPSTVKVNSPKVYVRFKFKVLGLFFISYLHPPRIDLYCETFTSCGHISLDSTQGCLTMLIIIQSCFICKCTLNNSSCFEVIMELWKMNTWWSQLVIQYLVLIFWTELALFYKILLHLT